MGLGAPSIFSSTPSPILVSTLKADSWLGKTAERKAGWNKTERSRALGSVVGKTENAPTAAQRLVKELEKDHDEQVRTVQARRRLRDMNKDRDIADLRAETAELRG